MSSTASASDMRGILSGGCTRGRQDGAKSGLRIAGRKYWNQPARGCAVPSKRQALWPFGGSGRCAFREAGRKSWDRNDEVRHPSWSVHCTASHANQA